MRTGLTSRSTGAVLRRLEASRLDYGPGQAANKLALLRRLDRRPLGSARSVLRLHEHLCFLLAYPDNRAVLSQVTRMLARFARRPDVRRHRRALADSGIAGTDLRYPFFWATAHRLAHHWPDRLAIDWPRMDDPGRLVRALQRLAPEAGVARRQSAPALRTALARLAGKGRADGTLIVRLVEAMPGDDFAHEAFFDALELPLMLRGGPGTPSRTHARHHSAPVVFCRAAPSRERPELRAAITRAPRSVRNVPRREGRALVDLAQDAMATRARDLDAFAYGNERDVRVVDDGEGLRWAVIGMVPERRPVLKATYGLLALRNGVPIGYLDAHVLWGCVDLSYNVFDTFRGGEAALVFGRLLAALHHLFDAVAFTLERYQLGHHNDEALDSGAWWFYYRLGFRPRGRSVRLLAKRELERSRARPGHRSSRRTLQRLATDSLHFEPFGIPAPEWTRLDAFSERLAEPRRLKRAPDVDALGRMLGASPPRDAAVSLAWQRWAPVVAALPDLARWSRAEKRALARVISARGGIREGDFLERFDAHPRLGAALHRLTGA